MSLYNSYLTVQVNKAKSSNRNKKLSKHNKQDQDYYWNVIQKTANVLKKSLETKRRIIILLFFKTRKNLMLKNLYISVLLIVNLKKKFRKR